VDIFWIHFDEHFSVKNQTHRCSLMSHDECHSHVLLCLYGVKMFKLIVCSEIQSYCFMLSYAFDHTLGTVNSHIKHYI